MTPSDITNRILVLTTEHQACRAEILQLSTKQQQLLVTSFAVSGYAATRLLIAKPGIEPHSWFACFVILSALTRLYVDCDRAIIRCATYVEGFLKVEITRLLMGPREGDSAASRKEFNSTVGPASKEKDDPYVLHTVEEVKAIMVAGCKNPLGRPAEDCRVLEWEPYIRSKGCENKRREECKKELGTGDENEASPRPLKGYLYHYLPDFDAKPRTASAQGSLIFLPGLLWLSVSLYFSFQPDYSLYRLALLFELPTAICLLANNYYELYVILPKQGLCFPPDHPYSR